MIELKEKMAEVANKCGFDTSNFRSLILGLNSEIGELSSLVALMRGVKKPKPSDLNKFGNWTVDKKAKEAGTKKYFWRNEFGFASDFSKSFTFEEAWAHEITREALKKELQHEAADVLVYLLQVLICMELDKLSGKPKTSSDPIEASIALMHYSGTIAGEFLELNGEGWNIEENLNGCMENLKAICEHLDVDLAASFMSKCQKLVARHV